MKKFEFRMKGRTGVLTIYGEFATRRLDEVKEALMVGLASADRLIVNVREVVKIEPACLELFCFAHRTSRSLKKSLVLAGTRSKAFRKAVFDAGLAACAGCIMI